MTWYEVTQGVIAAATLPVTIIFLVLFCRPSERWWSTWFGRSLFALALGVLLYSTGTVLYRFVGDYPLRPAVMVGATSLVFAAMVTRTAVLWRSQHTGRRLPSIADAPNAAEVIQHFDELVRYVEHLEDCPTPECQDIRARMVGIAHTLPNHHH